MNSIETEFFDLTDEKEFDRLMELQHTDDKMLQNKFNRFNHKQFNYALINIGQVLNIISTFFSFSSEYLESRLALDKDKVKNRELKKHIKDLNEKINLRFEFDDDTMIVPALIYYDNEVYLLINKCLFVDLIIDNADINL